MSALRSRNLDVNTGNDLLLPQPPTDTVSDLSWSPTADILAVSSWDSSVRIYEVSNGAAQPRAMYNHEKMCLSCCWWPDGSKVLSGGGDNAVRSYDLQSGQSVQVGAHDSVVTGVTAVDVGQPMVASVSYDKTLKYWDLRSSQPVATVQLTAKACHVSSARKLLVATCMDRQTAVINLDNPATIFKTHTTSLKQVSETVACMPDGSGMSQGSSEGRCDVHYLNPVTANANFTFKCHRRPVNQAGKTYDDVFSLESINFHPQYSTLLTAGGDGTISIWDSAQRTRLSTLRTENNDPITSTAYSTNGNYLAYATGYDWAKGYQFGGTVTTKIKIHPVADWEVKPKPK